MAGEMIAPEDGIRTERGFRDYARFDCTYGMGVNVRESSAVDPRVWVTLSGDLHLTGAARPHPGTAGIAPGYASAHLDRERAERLRDALNAWLSEVPDAE